MSDDWRLRVDLHEDGIAHRLSELLQAEELEHDLERSFEERVVVSVDGAELFCYTGTRDQADRARQVIRQLADQHGWTIDLELTHWHPTAEQWEDPDAPLPSTPAQTSEELQERAEVEREESAEQGYPEFEVRVQCTSRGEAAKVSRKLEAEGIPNVHRWSYVLIGADDEATAAELAKRLQGEVPADAQVTAELNQRVAYDHRRVSPFAFLGGLAG
jgi:hypothetical protein